MTRSIIVVGAGSAGCIVATRLSEDADTSVLLLEAGPDYPDIETAPDDIRSAFVFAGTDHDWGYQSEGVAARIEAVNLGGAGATIPVLRGKVVGGSSAVNGTSAMRPTPEDFRRWAATGCDLWAWDHVVPYLKRVETDPLPGEWHGTSGPIPIHRFAMSAMRPIHRAFVEAAVLAGHRYVDDHNAPDAIGAGPIPLNQREGIRQSTAVTYLARARPRPNFRLRADVVIDRLVIDGGRARGVRLASGEVIAADEVVVAAGSYGSPQVLMRSGIGDRDALEALGIACVAHLPHVGQNLRDHPMLVVAVEADDGMIGDPSPPVQTMLTVASQGSQTQPNIDVEIALFTVVPGQVFFGIGAVRPESIGEVCLDSADPHQPPRITLGFYRDARDVDCMVRGIRAVRELAATAALAPFLGRELFPGSAVTGEAELAAAVRATPTSYAHATGTCRMGTSAEDSVVDQQGRVHGVANLRVIDASIMPILPCVPTNMATMMLAERCAEWMR